MTSPLRAVDAAGLLREASFALLLRDHRAVEVAEPAGGDRDGSRSRHERRAAKSRPSIAANKHPVCGTTFHRRPDSCSDHPGHRRKRWSEPLSNLCTRSHSSPQQDRRRVRGTPQHETPSPENDPWLTPAGPLPAAVVMIPDDPQGAFLRFLSGAEGATNGSSGPRNGTAAVSPRLSSRPRRSAPRLQRSASSPRRKRATSRHRRGSHRAGIRRSRTSP
jgi:hypothetical protein